MSLTKDTLFYSLANWGQRLVMFITAPVMIAYLSAADYGYLNLARSCGFFLSTLGMLAVVDQGLPRFFIDSHDESEKTSYLSTAFALSMSGVIAISALTFLAIPILPRLFADIHAPIPFIATVVLLSIGLSVQYAGSGMLKWTFKAPLFTTITLVQTTLGAVLTIIGIVLLGWGARGVLLIAAFSALAAGIWSISAVGNYLSPAAFSKTRARELLHYSMPLLGLNIFAFFTRSLDRFFLAGMSSLTATGIFSVASTVASLFETLVSGFFFAWGPYVLATFHKDTAPRQYAHFFHLTACLGTLASIFLGLWGEPIIHIFRPDGAYAEIGIYIPWIVSGILIYYLGGYFTPGPSISRKTSWKLAAFALGAICNTVLNYLLIPLWGIMGACIATALASLAAGIFTIVISNRLYFIPYRWKSTFALILAFTAITSFMQHARFPYAIQGTALVYRTMATLILSLLAILPYIPDMKAMGGIKRILPALRGLKG